jgi:type I restriction enzyme S subunit
MEELVPKLRFPGFDDHVWDLRNLNNYSVDIVDGDRGTSYPKESDFYDSGYCLFLNAKNVTKSGFVFDRTAFITESKDLQLRKGKLVEGDIVLTTRGTLGNFAFYNDTSNFLNVRINSGMVIIRVNDSRINKLYLYKYFGTSIIERHINKIAFGSAQPQLTVKEIKQFPLSIPSLPEQTKIAEFLTAIDKRIELLTAKKEKLTLYKKGVMQKIFNQEIRFKPDEGGEFPEWEEKALGETCSFFSGGTPLTTNSTYYNGDIPFIKSGEINSKSTEQYITESGLLNSSTKLVEKGDLLFALYGATSGEVGISELSGAINQAVLCIRSEKLSSVYLCNYLRFSKSEIVGKYLQGGQGNLSASIIKSISVPFPSLSEQNKIAMFLTNLDAEIQKVQTQITLNQTYKKGLLQKMFV